MAVTTAALAFDDYHLESDEHDEAIDAHGITVELRAATRCACWSADTGQRDPACVACFPFGFLFEAPESLTVFGPSRRGLRRYEAEGSIDIGDAWFTLPTGKTPPHFSRLTLPQTRLRVDDILTKGTLDTIRFDTVLAVESAHYNVAVPRAGDPDRYDNVPTPLVLTGPSPDLTIAGRQVTWLNPAIPDGTRYVVRFTTTTSYVLWDVHDRNEQGEILPSKYLAKRVDFLLHPRGAAALSYMARTTAPVAA